MIYVGSAINLNRRWYLHQSELNRNVHGNSYLQNAYNKYGLEAFQFTIVELVEDQLKLLEIEQLWINASDCCNREVGYNICVISASVLGIKRSLETRAKMSLANKGRKHSEEAKKKMSESHKRYKASEETKAKLSIRMKGNKYAKNKTKGRKHTEAALIKMRGLKRSEETRARMSLAFKGRICSEETRAKISASQRQRLAKSDLAVN